jgi:hypothetical protein
MYVRVQNVSLVRVCYLWPGARNLCLHEGPVIIIVCLGVDGCLADIPAACRGEQHRSAPTHINRLTFNPTVSRPSYSMFLNSYIGVHVLPHTLLCALSKHDVMAWFIISEWVGQFVKRWPWPFQRFNKENLAKYSQHAQQATGRHTKRERLKVDYYAHMRCSLGPERSPMQSQTIQLTVRPGGYLRPG